LNPGFDRRRLVYGSERPISALLRAVDAANGLYVGVASSHDRLRQPAFAESYGGHEMLLPQG
jgi:hypothetical protein